MPISRAAAGAAALALSGLGVFGLQGVALAAPSQTHCPTNGQYPPSPKSGNYEVRGEGFRPCSEVNESVSAQSNPIFLGTAQAGDSGVVDNFVSLPAGLLPGLHHFLLVGVTAGGAAHTVSIPVTVAAAAPVAAAPAATGSGPSLGLSLPRTGVEIAGISTLGLVLIGGGAAALYSGRRRRTAA